MNKNNKIYLFSGLLIFAIFLIIFLFSNPSMKSNHNEQGQNQDKEHIHNQDVIYTCPMHPQVREKKPGSCPICGMNLVKVTDEKNNNKIQSDSSINLNISPYQASLVGIKPIEVESKLVTYKIPISGRIISTSTIAMQVFQSDLRYVKAGVHFSGHSEVFPEDQITGEVISVDNFADPSSRTIRVTGRIKDAGRNTLSESSFTGEILVNLGEKLIIPEQSVLFSGEGSLVYLYEEDILRPKKISLGPKVGEDYVVLSGLSKGDLISSGPNFLIDSESKIRGLNDQSHH